MTKRIADYNPKLTNRYVPDLSYAADVVSEGPNVVNFGAPAVAATTTVSAAAQATANTAYTATLATTVLDAEYGRTISYTTDAANTRVITARGRDYLGQPMTETATPNNTTSNGLKAFKWIDSVTANAGAFAGNISIGTTDALGLPYKATNVLSEETNGVRVSTLGTFVAGVSTNPQTATSGDPRGTYNPQTTLDGSAVITGAFLFDTSNLHGYPHYYA